VLETELEEYEYPTLTGWSRKMTEALEFHEYGLSTVCILALMEAGPSSMKRPVKEEHPGPPLSQRTTGSFLGSFRDSKNQKKKCLSSSSISK
jgi:hypothetical protein